MSPTTNAETSAIAAPFAPDPNDPRILMVDVGFPNGTFRWDVLAEYKQVEAAVIRVGQSNHSGWNDVQFLRNMEKAKANGKKRMGYHVLFPRVSGIDQAQYLVGMYNRAGELPEGPVWWDVELRHQQTPYTISKRTIEAHDEFIRLTNHRTGIYTGAWFTNGYMQTQYWFSQVKWWLATWLYGQPREHPGPPGLPATVAMAACQMHQTTSNGDGVLLGNGTDTTLKRIDLNRWMGTREEFNEVMSIEPEPEPEPHDHVAILKEISDLKGKFAAIKKVL